MSESKEKFKRRIAILKIFYTIENNTVKNIAIRSGASKYEISRVIDQQLDTR